MALSHRKSYLTLTPVNISLTAGTNIPAPVLVDTPPETPATYSPRPPTAGGGPLSSHPTTPDEIPGAFPPTPELEKENIVMVKVSTSTTSRREDGAESERADSMQTPISRSSSHQQQKNATTNGAAQMLPPQRPRKLFSLGNLRQSFSSSRTSLAATRPSTDSSQPASYTYDRNPNHIQNLKRPSSPLSAAAPERPRTSRTKSGSWFRRKSGLFMLNGDGLDAVVEDQAKSRPATRDSAKRMKENHNPAPLLPEIGGLSSSGELGWDEDMFKR